MREARSLRFGPIDRGNQAKTRIGPKRRRRLRGGRVAAARRTAACRGSSWRNVIRDNKLIALIEFSWHFAFHTNREIVLHSL